MHALLIFRRLYACAIIKSNESVLTKDLIAQIINHYYTELASSTSQEPWNKIEDLRPLIDEIPSLMLASKGDIFDATRPPIKSLRPSNSNTIEDTSRYRDEGRRDPVSLFM